MTTPDGAAGSAAQEYPSPAKLGRVTRPDGRPQRSAPPLRKIEVACLDDRGDITDFTRLVPALTAFDEAFAAFARGALLQTDRGVVAIEDLLPGDRVRTIESGFQPVMWKGSTLIHAKARGQDEAMRRLIRIPADALGIARPMYDLVLGPRARIVHSAPGIRTMTGAERALIPVRDFIDDHGFIELVPPIPVPVFHLAFAQHERLAVNGVELESYHPGPAHALGLGREMQELLVSLFPQVRDLADFGPQNLPRLRRSDLDLFSVA